MAGSQTEGKKTKKKTSAKAKTEKAAVQDTGFLQSEAAILGAFAVCVFLFLSNFHLCGTIGNMLSQIMLGVFGGIGYVAPVLLFTGIMFYASNQGNIRAVHKMLAVEVLLISLCGLIQLMLGGGYQEGQTLKDIYETAGESGMGGGVIGGALVVVLHTAVGTIGSYIFLFLLLIISVVFITERSFLSLIRKGSGKAYQYAKEDYGRRKELREEKKEERRKLRNEQRVQGVNLNSTDLSRGEPERYEEAPASQETFRETEAPAAAYTSSWKPMPGAADDWKEKEKEKEKAPKPENTFNGSIQISGSEPDEDDVVPFKEDFSLMRHKMDEDIFVSRSSRDFDDMELFSREKAEKEKEMPRQTEIMFPVKMEPVPLDEEIVDAGILDGEIADEELPEKELLDEVASDGELAACKTLDEESVDMPWASDIPASEPEQEYFHAPEETKRVVTSSGKVIERDTEEVVKKKRKQAAAEREEASTSVLQEIKKTEEKPKKPYVIPPMGLLTKGKPISGQSEREFKETAIKLQQTLKNFGVGVTVTNISCGPTVTRYELHPEQGVKVSRILSLADDIKLNLAAADIRIEAPIPGKAAVGIEVPNRVNSMVYLRDLLESDEFKKHNSRLAFAVGKDIGGQVIVADLAKMPHLLIAGQTGSGKSVGINTMIMSLIYRSSPEDVKLIMIDPKVVELSVYNGIPHLLIPVVTDPKKAAGALNWAVAEMMERYNKFASSNVRDLKGYNARVQALAESGDVSPEEIPAKLPQIVIIIDELADLMMVASGEVEDSICRLAQLARAAGIHLVIATQRPSVNVITGVIKANVPSRIAFSVASGTDSRTILDMVGAEKLLGNGDMLFYPSGYPKPLRVQGAFVSDGEVSRVTDFLKEQNEDVLYNQEIEKRVSQPSLFGGSSGGSDRDDLFVEAGKFIIEKDKASIGMLQRMFKIGFNRAARIMDQLAEAGVVGEEEGTKPRKILMSAEQFEEFLESGG